jgi:hypothetical protein
MRQDHTFASTVGRARALVVLAVTGLVLLAAAGGAEAKVHTYRAFGDKHSAVKKFRVVGVKPRAIVGARLVTRRGRTKVPLSIVRRAARSRRHILRVVVLPRGSRARASARGDTRLMRVSSGGSVKKLKVTTAPETTIVDGPAEGSQTTSSSAGFSFKSSSPAKAKFYCSLDDSPASRCSSGVVYSGLSVAPHSFTVYAVDRNGNPDPTPAARSWSVISPTEADALPGGGTGEEPTGTEGTGTQGTGTQGTGGGGTGGGGTDTAAPDTWITSGPAEGSSSTSTSASFSFKGEDNVGVAGFECALDGAEFSPCSPPKSYSDLGDGAHTFLVRATDAAGNADPTPASSTWTVASSTRVYTVPAAVDGSCKTDVTSQILSWLGSVPDGSTVAFASGACYRIEGTLTLSDRALTIEGNGATLRSFDRPDDQRAIWRIWNSDVVIRNLLIVGSYDKGGVFNASIEHSHGIDLRGTHAVIEGVSVSDMGGDCVYFGLGATRSSGTVRGGSCEGIGRNAVSVTSGNNILVEGVSATRIGYTVFDVEPNSGPGFGASDVVFNANRIGTYYLYAWSLVGNAPIDTQTFTNNRVSAEGLRVASLYPTYRPRDVTIADNASDSKQGPPAMELRGVDNLQVTGNTVPMTNGTMATVDESCEVEVTGNTYTGGSSEVAITNPAC